MINISITKEFTWDMAHILAGHQGACRNLHGHTYKLQVEITQKSNQEAAEQIASAAGMIMDFADMKKIIKSTIVDPLDHAFIYWKNSTDPLEHEIAALLKKHDRKIAEVEYRPTVEEMAQRFMEMLSEEMGRYGIKVLSIILWETPTSYARVTWGK